MDTEKKTEEQLAVELEAMYKHVASSEKFGAEDHQADEIPSRQYGEDISPEPATGGFQETAEMRTDVTRPCAQQPPLSENNRRKIITGALGVALFCLAVLLSVAFFWMTLYDVASFNADGKVYPLRINRITGNVVYFDGEQWRNTPVPVSTAPVPAALVPAAPMPVAAAPAPAVPPPAETAALPEKKTLPNQQEVPAPPMPRSELKASLPPAGKQPPPHMALENRLFAIQIRAFDNPADARKLIAELKKTGVDICSVAVPIRDRGIWHRVLIGKFQDKDEALKFMQDFKIRDYYPDSFVQKLSP